MSSDTTATKWGIAGSGKISSDFTSAILSCPAPKIIEHQVVAVAARDQSRAQDFANFFHIPKAYGSYKELAEDPEVEVVYIGVIHPCHAELTKLFLEAGKHVVCEKPITMNLKQAKEVTELAKSKSLFLMEATWTRFFPAIDKMRSELAANSIGDVKVLTVNLGQPMNERERIVKKELGGGAVMDVGCYTVTMANLVFGPEKPEKIEASGHLFSTGVDEMACITLKFSNSRMASLVTTANCKLDNTAKIYGNKGSIEVKDFWLPSEITCNGDTHSFPPPPSPDLFKYNYKNSTALQYEIQAVRQSLIKGELENPLMSHADSLWVMEVLDEIRRQLGVHYDADG